MRRVVSLILLALVALIVWNQRHRLLDAVRGPGDRPEPVAAGDPEELADSAEAKLARLVDARPPARVVLSEAEVQSLIEHRVADLLPTYVASPRIELDRSRVRLHFRVPTDRFPRIPELRDVMGFLPDTTDLVATGQLVPFDSRRVAFAVDEVSAARVPLPRRLIPVVLARIGRTDEPGLPPDAIALPLPPGAAGVYVHGDSLILSARDRAGAND